MEKCFALMFLFFCPSALYASNECASELSPSSNYSDLNEVLTCFNKKVKALEAKIEKLETAKVKDDNTSENNLPPDPRPTPVQTVERGGFTFELLQCARKVKKNIVCELEAVSNNDAELFIWVRHWYSNTHRTIAIATSGVQYIATSASLGASDQSAESVTYRMVSDLPLKLSISFSSIPSDQEGFALLDVMTDRAGVFQFRDIVFEN